MNYLIVMLSIVFENVGGDFMKIYITFEYQAFQNKYILWGKK
jgi:hypothetical protein